MKKLLASLFVLGLIITGTSAFALNHNMSVEYTRTMNRSASIAEDSCFFNPAGAAFLKDGLYVGVANQMIFRTQTVTETNNALVDNYAAFKGKEYEGVITALAFPTLGITYKTGPIAAFWHTGAYGGGGGGTYDEGLPMFTTTMVGAGAGASALAGTSLNHITYDVNFEGTEFKIGSQVGVAYAINDMLSAALAARVLYLMKTSTGKIENTAVYVGAGAGTYSAALSSGVGGADVDAEDSGLGWGAVAGFDVRPMKELNIGLKLEYQFKMEAETKVNKSEGGSAGIQAALDSAFVDGKKSIVTEPMEAWIGVDYAVLPNLTVSASFGYVFETMVDYDVEGTSGDEGANTDKEYQDKLMGGLGVEFKPMTELAVSVGYLYDGNNKKEAGQSELDWSTTTHYVSGGATYAIMPELDVTASCTYAIHSTEKGKTIYNLTPLGMGVITPDQEYTRNTISFGLGVNYRMVDSAAATSDTAAAPAVEEKK